MTAITAGDDLLRKAVSAPSEDIARTIMAQAGMRDDEIEKSITTSTGLVAYDLQAPAKNLYPVNTPIIKALPRVGGGVGTATNWKQVNALLGSGYDNTGWVPEGQRAGAMSYSVSSRNAAYVTLGEEDSATFEAINAGRTFEDVQASMKRRLLQKMMLKEEMAVLFGNASLNLGTPATPTLSSSGTGKTLPSATYSVIVVALTGEGYQNSSLSGGVATTKSVTGADGKSFTLSGGSSQKSAAATQAITLGAQLRRRHGRPHPARRRPKRTGPYGQCRERQTPARRTRRRPLRTGARAPLRRLPRPGRTDGPDHHLRLHGRWLPRPPRRAGLGAHRTDAGRGQGACVPGTGAAGGGGRAAARR